MEHLFCGHWLPPFIALALAALLGYILGRSWQGKNKRRIAVLEKENQALMSKLGAGGAIATGAVASMNQDLKSRIAELKAELKDAKNESRGLQKKVASLEAELAACNEQQANIMAAAAPASASTQDNLRKIEGIGSAIESLLHAEGIQTYAQLAQTPVADLRAILARAGERYRMHDPGTWPKQAELARDGRWHELNYWQEQLDGGKGPEFDSLVIPPPASSDKDDLKKVEGIGPKIEKLLHKAGIKTFAQLADADVSALKQTLTDAGERYRMHDPGTWPRQAALARDEKWAELKVWQDELKGGK